MAAAVGLCGFVLVARVASSAVAPLLCWWRNGGATTLVEWHPSGRGKAPTAADGDGLCRRRSDEMILPVSHPTEIDEDRTSSHFIPSILSVHCRLTNCRAAA
ncbi:putative retrotransposon hot spot (RHS) protein [Trypanosoma cruzi]|nr:putative retrotransposon hot spot (RHS) protein [Trypanosoma cruzi]